MKSNKTLYHFLDPDFAFPIVKYFYDNLLHLDINIVLIVSTRTFKPKRRLFNPLTVLDFFTYYQARKKIKEQFKPFGYPVLFVDDVNALHFIDQLAETSFAVCSGFNQIFKKHLIERFKDFVNLHPSLLPFYRGPTPVEWCVFYGEKYTGWTLHRVTEEIDEGPILYQRVIAIDYSSCEKIKEALLRSAQPILYMYLRSLIFKQPFDIEKVEAKKIYRKKIEYLSFFNR